MQTEFQRELSHSYMLLHPKEYVEESSYELNMIAENEIAGLLPMNLLHLNQEVILRYDITSLQPLSVFAGAGKIASRELRLILLSLISSLIEMEDYLLNLDHLRLDAELCFLRWDTHELFLPYDPSYEKDVRLSLEGLMEYLLTEIRHDDQKTVVLAYRIYHELQNHQTLLTELRQFLIETEPRELKEQAERTEGEPLELTHLAEAVKTPVEPDNYDDPFLEVEQKKHVSLFSFFKPKRMKQAMRESAPELSPAWANDAARRPEQRSEPGGEMRSELRADRRESQTVLLSAVPLSHHRMGCLVPLPEDGTRDRLELTAGDLLIGSQSDIADLVIPFPSISRIHARIYRRGDEYLIMDLSSKNGTRVDDRLLNGQEEVPLKEGAVVTFADCSYRFTMS